MTREDKLTELCAIRSDAPSCIEFVHCRRGRCFGLLDYGDQSKISAAHGAKRTLIPIENRRNFLEVSADIVEHVDPVFYGEPKAAAFKALGHS